MMAGLQQKITRHATKQKNVTHNKGKKSIKINSEMTQILELADKEVIMTLFHMFKSQRQRRYKKRYQTYNKDPSQTFRDENHNV